MSIGESVFGKAFWSLMEDEYRNCVGQDNFPNRYGTPYLFDLPGFKSVAEIIGEVSSMRGKYKTLPQGRSLTSDLSKPLKDVQLTQVIQGQSGAIRLEDILNTSLFIGYIPVLFHSFCFTNGTQSSEKKFADMVSASGKSSVQEIIRTFSDRKIAMQIADDLKKIFWEITGNRGVGWYFKNETDETGYRKWWPGASSGCGDYLKDAQVTTDLGKVTIKVANLSEQVDSNVRPYEWIAQLKQDDANESPDAIACGMVYVLEREDGYCVSSASSLRWASDAISDTDVNQVLAYLKQHANHYEDHFQTGDLCFLWLWERKEGSQKGAGKECLLAALKNLKKRFKKLKILVVNNQPAPFRFWGTIQEPAQIVVEKQASIESVQEYMEQIGSSEPFKGYTVFTMTHFNAGMETLRALGAADLDENTWN